MTRKRTLLTVGLALLVLLAGCASVGSDGDVAGGSNDGGEAFATSGDAEEMDGGGDGGGDGDGASAGGEQSAVSGQPLEVDRAIIRTGTVELRVAEFEDSRAAIADRARTHGGYVSESGSTHHTRDNQSWTTGYVVVRIPSDQFSDVLSDTRTRGTVLNEETRTRDVTDQLVDLEARLTNLRERRDRLRTFYEQANSTGELLRIEEELSSVQSDIEQLEATQRSLEDQVAFATLRVELNEPDRTPEEDPAFTASLASAFLGSVGSLADMVTGFVLFVAGVAPFLLFLGVPALGVGLLARRRLGSRFAPATDRTTWSQQSTPDEDATEPDDPPASGADGQSDSE